MERTKPVTVEAMVRLAETLKASGRTSATFSEVAKFIGCHHPSVRNWLTGSASRRNVEALSEALKVPVRVEKSPKGHMVLWGSP
jgi:hypothetical protein